ADVVPAVSRSIPVVRVNGEQDKSKAGPETTPSPRLVPVPNEMALDHQGNPLIVHPAGPAGVVPQAPRELSKAPLPPYRIEPPDILLVEVVPVGGPIKFDQQIRGQHLVRPDGTIGLGIYGSAYVAGMTLEEAREAIAQQLAKRAEGVK